MTIRYEINPPKITSENLARDRLQELVTRLRNRIDTIRSDCGGIHLTDSVLGMPRVSPITVGSLIRRDGNDLKVSASVRVRDRNLTSLTQSISDAVLLDLDGILFLKGDKPPEGPKDSGLVPSEVVRYFNEIGFGDKVDIYLSLPSNPDFDKIQKKIDSKPAGFITQVISSVEQMERIVDKLKPQGFKIIPIILFPSEKNTKSAKFLNLDWSGYQDDFGGFISKIHKLAGNVLITSPNDFDGFRSSLREIQL